MRKLGECEDAVSPVIGVILLLGLIVILGSIIAISVFAFKLPASAPHAKIVIVEAKGNMDTALYKNTIALRHKGGDALFENNTGIIITGKGYAYNTGSYPSPAPSAQDIRVTYSNLAGENYVDGYDGEIVDGISWDAGETITLFGSDRVTPPGVNQRNTADNKWKLDDGTAVVVTIIDTTTNEVIAVAHATVKDA